uniref:Uncharacterized protein n=1 Tax=Anguilla anguilla TaxID=7936 RepID=A0A0E9T789_ANGAN
MSLITVSTVLRRLKLSSQLMMAGLGRPKYSGRGRFALIL